MASILILTRSNTVHKKTLVASDRLAVACTRESYKTYTELCHNMLCLLARMPTAIPSPLGRTLQKPFIRPNVKSPTCPVVTYFCPPREFHVANTITICCHHLCIVPHTCQPLNHLAPLHPTSNCKEGHIQAIVSWDKNQSWKLVPYPVYKNVEHNF